MRTAPQTKRPAQSELDFGPSSPSLPREDLSPAVLQAYLRAQGRSPLGKDRPEPREALRPLNPPKATRRVRGVRGMDGRLLLPEDRAVRHDLVETFLVVAATIAVGLAWAAIQIDLGLPDPTDRADLATHGEPAATGYAPGSEVSFEPSAVPDRPPASFSPPSATRPSVLTPDSGSATAAALADQKEERWPRSQSRRQGATPTIELAGVAGLESWKP